MKRTAKTAFCAALAAALLISLCACGAQSAPAAEAPAPQAPAAQPAAPQGGVTQIVQTTETAPEVKVSANSTVRLTPDKATVTFGVTTEESSAERAQTKNSEAVQKVVDTLTERGVDEKSIRTQNYNMYPRYDYSERGMERIIGYTVYTTMSVEDQDIDSLGKLLQACVAAGINRVDSVRFLCSGYDDAYAEALEKAVAAAREKAETLASAAGRTLGEAVEIVEGWQDTSARYGNESAKGSFPAAEMAMDAAAPVMQPGETEIGANVTVTFRLK